MMEAISHAAAEITSEMPTGGVDVRLDGRDLEFVVDLAPSGPPAPPRPPAPPPPPAPEDVEDGNVARITLRLPESVKARAEEFAARSGHSLNTWLVNVVKAATREDAIASTSTCRASGCSATSSTTRSAEQARQSAA